MREGESEAHDEARVAALEQVRFLADAGRTLAASLDYERTMQNVASLAVPAIADWCVVDIVEDDDLRRVALVHGDPEKVRLVQELRRRYPDRVDAGHGVRHVIRTGEPELVQDIAPELLQAAASDGEHLRLLESLQLRSYLVVPLRARGVTLGALTLVYAESERRYGEHDLYLARELAAHAALAIDNARLVRDLERTQSHLESTAAELESQAEELHATVEELEATTRDLLEANESLERARSAAEHAQAQAESANAAKSHFLATMSHELRTPLNAIDGYAELIELGVHGPVTEQQRHALGRLRRSQKRLLTLINDVLDFAKLEAGQVTFRTREFAVADLLADVHTLLAPEAAARQLDIRIDAAGDDLVIRADRERTEQILLNLVVNAIKFTAEGGSVRLAAESGGDFIQLSVSDTGMGIPAEQLHAVFDPFTQVDTGMIRDHGGVGLGLSISRDLARSMGGELSAQSSLGHGSTFSLILPSASRVPPAEAAPGLNAES